jgi:hypothetical protein
MKRRDLLWTALLAAFGGCGDEVKEPTATTTPSPTYNTTTDSPTPDANQPTYEATDQRHVALDGEPFSELRIDVLPEAVPFAGEVELEEQPADGEDGILRIGLHNRDTRPWAMHAAVPLRFPPPAARAACGFLRPALPGQKAAVLEARQPLTVHTPVNNYHLMTESRAYGTFMPSTTRRPATRPVRTRSETGTTRMTIWKPISPDVDSDGVLASLSISGRYARR